MFIVYSSWKSITLVSSFKYKQNNNYCLNYNCVCVCVSVKTSFPALPLLNPLFLCCPQQYLYTSLSSLEPRSNRTVRPQLRPRAPFLALLLCCNRKPKRNTACRESGNSMIHPSNLSKLPSIFALVLVD